MRFCLCFVIVCLASKCFATDASPSIAESASPLTALDTSATPVDRIKVAEGFQVELLYTVPKDDQGSWVNMCADPKGRLIVSDQYGSLYRVTPPAIGTKGDTKVEKISLDIGQAHGLLWAFDSLYVVVNGDSEEGKNGLYRVRDLNHDDEFDSIEPLRVLDGGGEHGPHAVLLTPDGKSLYVVCGNNTKPTEVVRSRVPTIWDEDQLLPRIYGRGFMRGTTPPAGAIYKTDPAGKKWERVSSGYRNEFDAAVNADGELFTYDADMEWDIGTPWYRPTRVCHVVSGSDWGWRNGSAKWPVYYADTLPPVVDIGVGSPTGITFGYGAKFPAKYQNALFINDWTYGKLYSLFLEPQGSSYGAKVEEFVSAAPLPLTDTIINPHDGAMYFLIGGRKTQSGLYRVTYVGKESTSPAIAKSDLADERDVRHKLEDLHVGKHPDAVKIAWPYLKSPDRFLRHAARTALEHQPLETWQQRALDEKDPQASLTALLALVRKIPRSYHPPSNMDLDTPPPSYPAPDDSRHPLQEAVLSAIGRIDWAQLSTDQRREFLRLLALTCYRLGPPDERTRAHMIERLNSIYPTSDREMNVMLTELLCYLQAPSAAEKGTKLLAAAPTQEGQLDLVRSLRFLEAGWTPETRRALFEWFARAQAYKGGANFQLFVDELKADALKRLPESERLSLDDLINAPVPNAVTPLSATPRPLVKAWKMEEILPLLQTKMKHRNFDHGREMFAAANCFGCHRFANEGGAMGPDLTALATRFSPRDILESVLEPSKVISDQYATAVAQTKDGNTIVGRIINFEGDSIAINTNMLDPNAIVDVNREDIETLSNGKVSMMPVDLLNTLNEDELLDLMAFLLSRGDPQNAMFAK